jgi:hypothetical protein
MALLMLAVASPLSSLAKPMSSKYLPRAVKDGTHVYDIFGNVQDWAKEKLQRFNMKNELHAFGTVACEHLMHGQLCTDDESNWSVDFVEGEKHHHMLEKHSKSWHHRTEGGMDHSQARIELCTVVEGIMEEEFGGADALGKEIEELKEEYGAESLLRSNIIHHMCQGVFSHRARVDKSPRYDPDKRNILKFMSGYAVMKFFYATRSFDRMVVDKTWQPGAAERERREKEMARLRQRERDLMAEAIERDNRKHAEQAQLKREREKRDRDAEKRAQALRDEAYEKEALREARVRMQEQERRARQGL